MVLGVCRRYLDDLRDVEDAFQATFVVLVQRAGAVRVDGSLGPWLHGVKPTVSQRGTRAAALQKESPRGLTHALSRPPTQQPSVVPSGCE